jgi:hypothetical protein
MNATNSVGNGQPARRPEQAAGTATLPAAHAGVRPSRQPRPAARSGPGLQLAGASPEARRSAAVILEVLAGLRSPPQAAVALAVSLPRYYVVELRALQGLLAACEARPKGRVRTAQSELAALRRQCEQLKRQCDRQQSLLRLSQRAVGLPAATAAAPARSKGKKRRQRKPTVRALRVAAQLRQPEHGPGPGATVVQGEVTA